MRLVSRGGPGRAGRPVAPSARASGSDQPARWRRRSASCAGSIHGGVRGGCEFELGRTRLPRPGAVADHDLPGAGPARPDRPGAPAASPGGLPALAAGPSDGAVAAGHRRRHPPGRRQRGQGRHRGRRPLPVLRDRHRGARATGRAVCLAFAAGVAATTGCRRRCSPTTANSSPAGSPGPGRGGDVRADLPGERHRGPQHQAPLTDHDGEGGAVPPDAAARAARPRPGLARRGGRAGGDRRVPRGVQHQPAAPVPGDGVPGGPVRSPGTGGATAAARFPRP